MILNLGCGRNQRRDAVNVDITPYPGVDMVVDLSIYPWPWEDGSIDGIYSAHFIEHLPDTKRFLVECIRILKKGGFLRLNVPHSSNIGSVGCLGHYRTFSYDTLNDYLGRDFYMFKTKQFETIEQRLLWWYEIMDAQGELPRWMVPFIWIAEKIINRLIALSPRMFENVWCYWVGGAREVVYKGIKI